MCRQKRGLATLYSAKSSTSTTHNLLFADHWSAQTLLLQQIGYQPVTVGLTNCATIPTPKLTLVHLGPFDLGQPLQRQGDPVPPPPPRIRSNSPIPLRIRGVSASAISAIAIGSAPTIPRSASAASFPLRSARASNVGSLYSSSESHVPQSGHFPIHLACTAPQLLQRK